VFSLTVRESRYIVLTTSDYESAITRLFKNIPPEGYPPHHLVWLDPSFSKRRLNGNLEVLRTSVASDAEKFVARKIVKIPTIFLYPLP